MPSVGRFRSVTLPLALVFTAAGAFIGWQLLRPVLRRRRVARWSAAPFPADWQRILETNCCWYPSLPAPLVERVHRTMLVFLADKSFVGCNGLDMTDTMRVTIAGHACLLVANLTDDPFPWVREILVYPETFLVDREYVDEAGVRSVGREALAGESWDEGRVIVSWQDIVEDARCADGVNVVVHEFAHQLDHASGVVNGAPVLRGNTARWSGVMADEFARLAERVDNDDTGDSVIDPYGATDPGEFFAVVFEAFIETPRALARDHPAMYDLLCSYSRLDPAAWGPDHTSVRS